MAGQYYPDEFVYGWPQKHCGCAQIIESCSYCCGSYTARTDIVSVIVTTIVIVEGVGYGPVPAQSRCGPAICSGSVV
ncbi:hypothetical protein Sste5344_001080 [Sporothrix stenoceras]